MKLSADIDEKTFNKFKEISERHKKKQTKRRIILYVVYVFILGILSLLIITNRISVPSFLEIAIIAGFIFSLAYPPYVYFIKSEIPPTDY